MFTGKFRLSFKKARQDVCVSAAVVNKIQQKAKTSQNLFSDSYKSSSENMAGDLQSRIRGAGIDFEENKPYQPGSDSRHINWRTFARTQQLYVNIYNEDKRPSTYIVLDQRTKMYFGTRKQLKIKQALKIAIYTAFSSMHKQQNVSGVQILSKPRWHSTYSGTTSISSFISAINQPHFENIEATAQPGLNDVLLRLQLQEGAELVIISDLHDINSKTISILYDLSQKHTIKIVQIMDPVEKSIPDKGFYNIKESTVSRTLAIIFSKTLAKNYSESITKKFNAHIKQCINMGITFNQLLTTDNIFQDSA